MFLLFIFFVGIASQGCSAIENCVDCNKDPNYKCAWCPSETEVKCIEYTERHTCEDLFEFQESCSDITLQQCQRHPKCEDCKRDANCVWINKGNFDVTTKTKRSYVVDLSKNGTCWPGVFLTSFPKPDDVHKWGNSYKIKSTQSFYMQCDFPEIVWWLIILGCIFGSVLLVCVFGMCFGGICTCLCCKKCMGAGGGYDDDDPFSINSSYKKKTKTGGYAEL